jgi:hypothetical protein
MDKEIVVKRMTSKQKRRAKRRERLEKYLKSTK